MKNKVEDLRNHLFATIEALLDKDNPMDLERAQVVAEVGQVLVNSAKVEVEFLRATGAEKGTGFISLPAPEKPVEGEAPKMRRVGV